MRIKITSLDIQNEIIDVSSSLPTYRPDPDWVHVDANGDEHRWHFDEKGHAGVPTLRQCERTVDERCECCGTVIGTEREVWFEDQCGARVDPGYRIEEPGVTTRRSMLSGMRSISGKFTVTFATHHGATSCRKRLRHRGFDLAEADVAGDEQLVGHASVSSITYDSDHNVYGDFVVDGPVSYRAKGA